MEQGEETLSCRAFIFLHIQLTPLKLLNAIFLNLGIVKLIITRYKPQK